jgi:hypothetical protein
MAKERVKVVCPSCQTTMTVDPKTGLVIHSEQHKSAYSFDEAVEKEKARKDKSDELFAKAFQDEKKRQDSLEEKFEEALKSKDDLDEPPPRPWDLD